MTAAAKKTKTLLCVCGTSRKVPAEWDRSDVARKTGWTFYPNSPHKDGTNALCDGCQDDDPSDPSPEEQEAAGE